MMEALRGFRYLPLVEEFRAMETQVISTTETETPVSILKIICLKILLGNQVDTNQKLSANEK